MRFGRRATLVGAAAAVATVAVGVPALAADPQAPERTRPPGMERMHELMLQGNPGMERMHEMMTSGAPPQG
ncbi:MAG: hypothetical protein ACRDJ9_06110 [Dehalococcoidia bacterium]